MLFEYLKSQMEIINIINNNLFNCFHYYILRKKNKLKEKKKL